MEMYTQLDVTLQMSNVRNSLSSTSVDVTLRRYINPLLPNDLGRYLKNKRLGLSLGR